MRTIFWNVDTQFDFMRKEGKLYVPDAELIEPVLARLTQLARDYGIRVVNTGDSHHAGSPEISAKPDFVRTFPEHCMYGTPGAELVHATRPEDAYLLDWRDQTLEEKAVLEHRNVVLTKDVFDVFGKPGGSPHVERVLELLKPDRAIVYGVATNVCVDFAVRGLLERKIEVYVVRDAIKGLPGIPDPTEMWIAGGAKLIEAATIDQYVR